MVEKQTNFGKMEKGKSGRLLLYATQALCAFCLLHLLYIELITFKSTCSSSPQIKRRQILSEWKLDGLMINSTLVNKDDQHQSAFQYLLAGLVKGLISIDRSILHSLPYTSSISRN
ncbi:hypothetical protein QVD17_27164 [Tagetes erecta]|uniref:Uncharacterized protein n=1 Tax=Tagetes erecta TaxID=13708 RepID=A0AAD8K879_TARER|nr:hypothetical protein QVD17_27164 [Tagetes erecta]